MARPRQPAFDDRFDREFDRQERIRALRSERRGGADDSDLVTSRREDNKENARAKLKEWLEDGGIDRFPIRKTLSEEEIKLVRESVIYCLENDAPERALPILDKSGVSMHWGSERVIEAVGVAYLYLARGAIYLQGTSRLHDADISRIFKDIHDRSEVRISDDLHLAILDKITQITDPGHVVSALRIYASMEEREISNETATKLARAAWLPGGHTGPRIVRLVFDISKLADPELVSRLTEELERTDAETKTRNEIDRRLHTLPLNLKELENLIVGILSRFESGTPERAEAESKVDSAFDYLPRDMKQILELRLGINCNPEESASFTKFSEVFHRSNHPIVLKMTRKQVADIIGKKTEKVGTLERAAFHRISDMLRVLYPLGSFDV